MKIVNFWAKEGPNRGLGDPLRVIQWDAALWLIYNILRKLNARNKKKLLNRFLEIWQKV